MENCRCSEMRDFAFRHLCQRIRSIQNQIQFSNGFSQSLFADAMDKHVSIPNKIEEHQKHQNFPDESTIESTFSIGIGKNLIVEDDLKSPSVVDSPAGVSASLPEGAQILPKIKIQASAVFADLCILCFFFIEYLLYSWKLF
ncbi:hypothetical protein P8452_11077 [Trifolium repens]|nr:hypothetical protein P8452_11077 [Trifolium repens]